MHAELVEKIGRDLVTAMKAKDSLRVSVLRMAQAAIKNAGIEKMSELTEQDVQAVLRKEIKKRGDAAAQYSAANRPELAEKEHDEVRLLEEYLPAQISEQELIDKVKSALEALPETDQKNMGTAMKAAKAAVGDAADGSRVAAAVKHILGM